MFLKRGEDNFDLHSGAVLLDPEKTFGSNVILEMDTEEVLNITALVDRTTQFFGPNVGFLNGGGDGVMGLAANVGRENNCLAGTAYLELESKPLKVAVDFFNTFQEKPRQSSKMVSSSRLFYLQHRRCRHDGENRN